MSAPGPDALASNPLDSVGTLPVTGPVSDEQAAPSQEVQERLAEMPLPRNLQSLVLMGIFALLILFALYFTGEVVLPIK